MGKYLAIYGKPRYLGIVECDEEIKKGEYIIVESLRGEETAIVAGELSSEQETKYRQLKNTSEHGDGTSKNTEPVVTDLTFLAFATEEDLKANEEYRHEEDEILRSAKELLKPHELDMKMIDVEFLRNRKKLFFYFSSEQRVDFRAYVRDLAREFKTRIELRQIGVRDEAKVIKGLGPCGQPCCCSYWLNQFAPICIKMVKEQNLALNPAKISGICGRLMCCLCFEHNVYHEIWENLPNPGSKIKTPNGNIVIAGIELHTKSVRCYIPGKGEIKVPAEKFKEFKETVTSGGEWITEDEHVTVTADPQAIYKGYSSHAEEPKLPAKKTQESTHANNKKSGLRENAEEPGIGEGSRKKPKKRRRKPSAGPDANNVRLAPKEDNKTVLDISHDAGLNEANSAVPLNVRKSRRRRGRGGKKNPAQVVAQE